MLFETHHPPIHHAFISSTTLPHHLSITPSSLPTSPPFPFIHLHQGETEMYSMQEAGITLKKSCRNDMLMEFSFSPQRLSSVDENVVSCDDFCVDDLLDFSHEEEEAIIINEEKEKEKEEENLPQQNHVSASVTLSPHHISLNQHFHSVPVSELTVPDEDAKNLEWLSHFVEESFSVYPTPPYPNVIPAATQNPSEEEEPSELVSAISLLEPLFRTLVPTKARSKRTKTTGGGGWLNGVATWTWCCTHCGSKKTPQRRQGPRGPKTLCNACGVRYRSGRLFPEYRPACSPTFSSELHSNHHHTVEEMRRKRRR